MKHILAENLLRFGVKNLSEDVKKKLSEQTVGLGDWMIYPHYLAKYKPKNDNKLTVMSMPPNAPVVFIKPGVANIEITSESKFDGKAVTGLTGKRWMFGPGLTADQIIFGNVATGTVGNAQAGQFVIYRVKAQPSPIPSTEFGAPTPTGKEITAGMTTYPTTIVKTISQPRLDYAGFAKDLWSIITLDAPVKLDNGVLNFILPLVQTFVKNGIVTDGTPEQKKMNAYSLLTQV